MTHLDRLLAHAEDTPWRPLEERRAELAQETPVDIADIGSGVAVLAHRAPGPFGETAVGRLGFAPDDAEALAALPDVLASWAGRGPVDVAVGLEHAAVLGVLPAGWRVSRTSLVGTVPHALAALAPRRRPLADGFIIRAMEPADLRPLVEQREAFFAAHPHLAPVAPVGGARGRARVAAQIAFLEARRAEDPGLGSVLLREGEIVGSFGFAPRGACGSVGMFLDPSVHGRGLAWAAYARLVDVMAARGLGWITGSTANPAVLHIGRELGREVAGWTVSPT